MKGNLLDVSFISGMKIGLELLDQDYLESEGAWGIVIDLAIIRFAFLRNIDLDN